jgi:hypothetical protein
MVLISIELPPESQVNNPHRLLIDLFRKQLGIYPDLAAHIRLKMWAGEVVSVLFRAPRTLWE